MHQNSDLLEKLDAICQPYGCQSKVIFAEQIETIRAAKARIGDLERTIAAVRSRLKGDEHCMLESIAYLVDDSPPSVEPIARKASVIELKRPWYKRITPIRA